MKFGTDINDPLKINCNYFPPSSSTVIRSNFGYGQIPAKLIEMQV